MDAVNTDDSTAGIKLVIFDMGGVVVQNAATAGAIAAHLGISEEAFFRGANGGHEAAAVAVAAAAVAEPTSPYNVGVLRDIQRGTIDSGSFWRDWTARTGIPVSGDPWYDFFNPVVDPQTLAVITGLKARGKRVVCGTNTLLAHYRKHKERGDYAAFAAVYASHELGVIKPEAAFWRYILEREHAQPSETLFIDDLEENIRAAAALGLHVHHFTSAARLAAELGIPVT